VAKFIENEFYDDYSRLIIFNLVGVTRHKELFVGKEDVFQINTKQDIWDYNDFARKIMNKTTPELKEIADFLQQELKITPASKLPKEIQTIITLIDHLSNCDVAEIDAKFIEEPDPDGKINQRFINHSKFLENTYIELYSIYGTNLETVKEMTDIGTVQVTKKSLYLKMYSDKILTECEGNPKLALDTLTQKFAELIGQKNIEYDETAITFFLVDELIRCNVFPNSEVING